MNEKELREQLTLLHKEAEEIRKKHEGKPGDMPGDELERWEKCIADADKIQRQIDAVKKQAANAKWAATVEDAEKEIVKAKTNEGARSDVVKAWNVHMQEKGHDAAYRLANVTDREAKGLTVGSMPGGGYFLVPIEIAQEIIRIAKEQVFVRQYSRATTLVTSESLGIVTMGDIDDFDWTSELETGNEDTNEPFGRRELSPKPMAKRVKVSKKLLRMSPTPEQELLDYISYVKTRTEEKAFLTGSGANRPLGILTASADGISTARDITATAANDVSGDDFIKCVALMHSAYRPGLRWIFHRNTEARLRLKKDSDNNYLWSPFGGLGMGLQGGFAPSVAGYGYDLSEFMTDPNSSGTITSGTYLAALCNYAMGYRIVDALDMQVVPLYELYAASNQQGYIFRAETDAQPVNEAAFARLIAL